MNHYAQALAELQIQPDHELKQIGDQWQTPKALAWGLFHQFAPTLGPVVLDMFADNCNALVPNYYDAEDNALTQELAADLRRLGGAAYGNPPYSRPCVDSEDHPITGMEAILNYCREQRALGAKIMLLIKGATSETWWPEDADFIQFISGRIGFEVPSWYVPRDPKKDKPSASGFASAVVIFDAGWQGERRPEARLRRDDLITTGQIILDMIHRQAVELTLAADQVIRATTHKLAPALPEQPTVAGMAAWEPPVSDDATNGGFNTVPARSVTDPCSVITSSGSQQQLVSAFMVHLRKNLPPSTPDSLLPTIVSAGQHHATVQTVMASPGEYGLTPEQEAGALRVSAFLMRYYSNGGQWGAVTDPMHTITTKDRLALVTVTWCGNTWVIVDIGLRMLVPKELYGCQGMPRHYIHDRGHDGKPLSITDQVLMVGNSVSPPPMAAIARANNPYKHLQVRRAA